jgi:mycofactocin biosynthetic radical S-adenosylmethionine protein MftC
MDKRNRFILRKEYFGGLIYDRSNMGVEILDVEEYDFMRQLKTNQLRQAKTEKQKTLVNKLKLKKIPSDKTFEADYIEAPIIIEGVTSAPLRTYYHITFGCNLTCKHCMNGGTSKSDDELTTKEAITVLDQLAELGSPELRITGGEPTIRKDLFEIVDAAYDRNMGVAINTNGVFGRKIRENIIDSKVDCLIISVDGNEETHDAIRGKGNYKKTMDTIEFFVDYNKTADQLIHICLNPTITRNNVHLAEYLIRKGAELGGKDVGMEINFMPLRPFGNAKNILNDMLDAEGWYKFTQDLQRIRDLSEVKESKLPIHSRNMDLFGCYENASNLPFPFDRSSCGAATFRIGLSPDGRGNVCGFIGMYDDFKTPSIREASILDIWHSDGFNKLRNVIKEPCEPCDYYKKECVGICKAMSYIITGNLGKYDPYCFAHLLGKNGCSKPA